jgi:hypothetical protein
MESNAPLHKAHPLGTTVPANGMICPNTGSIGISYLAQNAKLIAIAACSSMRGGARASF